ncbi:S10 family serine carboxypeptidase-like protein [Roseiterribacter gracilis]|uniref:Peptidase S10 n=1 Tax=Roseiterribacter gracilis TaxID=2812848 RepID=A0A8S8XKK0_9PROT|nr:peptidase S10 [Rhodospirillales bacterium TMPK1]
MKFPLILVALTFATSALAQDRAPVVAVTQHEGKFNGQTVPYTATVAENFLKDASGKDAAAIVTIAYTRSDVKDAAKRPVLFLFNGGPGASSSPLHMNALGPVLRPDKAPRDDASFRPNPYSPLDACDLVFIDPVSTGLARPFPGVDPKPWYSRTGDAIAVKTVIADWLKANKREASPRFVMGESYGTVRAAMLTKVAPALTFDGILLVAMVGDTSGREMPYVAALPTMAAGAWFHQKIDRRGRTVEQIYDEAVKFARTDYLEALVRGSSLPAPDRARIAKRMSSLIGLPADLIERENLRVSKNVFMFNLLKDKTLRTGMLDMRVTAPLEEGAQGGIDDPSLGVAPKRVAGAPAPTPESIGAVPSPALGQYLTGQLKFPSNGETYIGVNFAANAKWDHEGNKDVIAYIGEAMKADPKLRLFWSAGYYDLTTPAYAGRYTLDQDGIPADRLTAVYFAGPHGVYSGEDNLATFNKAVRAFVTR